MSLVQKVNDRLFELYKGYEDVRYYIEKWHVVYDDYRGEENFPILYKDNEQTKIDTKGTLHQVDGETLLKMAIDLGIETPDFIRSIPKFKNELKSSYETASQTFEKAFKNVEEDPSFAIALANSALESIIKEILKDERITVQSSEKDTLSSLIKSICKEFQLGTNNDYPNEIKTIASSLINCSKAIEDLRSDKTLTHGKTDEDYIVSDPLYAYFVVNAVSTVGLFLLNFYKSKYSLGKAKEQTSPIDDLPF